VFQRTTLPLLAVAVVIAACGESTAPTTTMSALSSPSEALGGPLNPGQSMVYRFETFDVFVGVNGEGTLLSLNGVGTTDLATSAICGGAAFDAMTVQEIASSDGAVNQLRIGRQVTQMVLAIPAGCSDTPLAVGTGNFQLQDNDAFFSGTRMNSFGWTANGTLYDPVTGDAYLYSEQQRAVFRAGVQTPGWTVERITLTPISGQ
jgi:hypothetical protein